jgi:hypothetical protein
MTDQELEVLLNDLRQATRQIHALVELQDYIDQIELMATIVSHYGQQHPDTNDLQVRMMGRIAGIGSLILREAEEKLSSSIEDAQHLAREIQAQRMRQQEKPAQCQHCTDQYINLLQVITEEVTV